MTHLDRVLGSRIKRLESWNQLACLKDLNLELVVGHSRDFLGKILATAVNRVERLREARCKAPLDLRRRLRNRRRGDRGRGGADCGNFQKITTLHSGISLR